MKAFWSVLVVVLGTLVASCTQKPKIPEIHGWQPDPELVVPYDIKLSDFKKLFRAMNRGGELNELSAIFSSLDEAQADVLFSLFKRHFLNDVPPLQEELITLLELRFEDKYFQTESQSLGILRELLSLSKSFFKEQKTFGLLTRVSPLVDEMFRRSNRELLKSLKTHLRQYTQFDHQSVSWSKDWNQLTHHPYYSEVRSIQAEITPSFVQSVMEYFSLLRTQHSASSVIHGFSSQLLRIHKTPLPYSDLKKPHVLAGAVSLVRLLQEMPPQFLLELRETMIVHSDFIFLLERQFNQQYFSLLIQQVHHQLYVLGASQNSQIKEALGQEQVPKTLLYQGFYLYLTQLMGQQSLLENQTYESRRLFISLLAVGWSELISHKGISQKLLKQQIDQIVFDEDVMMSVQYHSTDSGILDSYKALMGQNHDLLKQKYPLDIKLQFKKGESLSEAMRSVAMDLNSTHCFLHFHDVFTTINFLVSSQSGKRVFERLHESSSLNTILLGTDFVGLDQVFLWLDFSFQNLEVAKWRWEESEQFKKNSGLKKMFSDVFSKDSDVFFSEFFKHLQVIPGIRSPFLNYQNGLNQVFLELSLSLSSTDFVNHQSTFFELLSLLDRLQLFRSDLYPALNKWLLEGGGYQKLLSVFFYVMSFENDETRLAMSQLIQRVFQKETSTQQTRLNHLLDAVSMVTKKNKQYVDRLVAWVSDFVSAGTLMTDEEVQWLESVKWEDELTSLIAVFTHEELKSLIKNFSIALKKIERSGDLRKSLILLGQFEDRRLKRISQVFVQAYDEGEVFALLQVLLNQSF